MIRGLIHQEVIAILNMYAPNNRTAKYVIKQKLIELKGKIEKFPYLSSDKLLEMETSTPSYHLLISNRTNRQEISEKIELNTINKQDPTIIYITLHPTTAKYTFFPSTLETCNKLGHILDH